MEPDYKGFMEHLLAAEEAGAPIDISYLIQLAEIYDTPIPNTKEWKLEFNA